MKIALYNVTTTTKTGGVESFVWELARNLAAIYPDLQVDIIGGKSPAGFSHINPGERVRIITRPYLSREAMRKIPVVRKMYGLTKLVERLSFGITTFPLLWREKYDILHIQKPYDLPTAKLLRLARGTKILFGCHGKDYFPLDRLFSKKLDGAVSCSHYNAATVQEHYGLLPEVVYNGIDVELFSPRLPEAELRAKYAAPNERIIIWVGRLVRWKGLQYLLEATALLLEWGIPVKLLVAGSGEYQPELDKLTYNLNIDKQVVWLGNVPNRELPRYYAISDAIVGTSFANETFGIALCEAAACERPVVASCFGGFKEVVVDDETGFHYTPQQPHELAEKLAKLLGKPEMIAQMGKAGRQFVVNNFTWQKVAERVYHKYREMLGSN
jgi:glycosyltransferase involved in cell wall biosynthesis